MLNRFLRLTTFIFLSTMAVLVALQVFLRYVLNNPTVWSEEAARFSLVYLCFFGACLALKRGESLRVTFFVKRFSPKTYIYIDIIMKILIIIFLFFVLCFGMIATWKLRNLLSTALQWSKSILYFSLLPPISLMIVITMQQIKSNFQKLMNLRLDKNRGRGAEL